MRHQYIIHSSGPWKTHKYVSNDGGVYKYQKDSSGLIKRKTTHDIVKPSVSIKKKEKPAPVMDLTSTSKKKPSLNDTVKEKLGINAKSRAIIAKGNSVAATGNLRNYLQNTPKEQQKNNMTGAYYYEKAAEAFKNAQVAKLSYESTISGKVQKFLSKILGW